MFRHSYWSIFLIAGLTTASAQVPNYILKDINYQRSTQSNIDFVVFSDGAILSDLRLHSAVSTWFRDYEYASTVGNGHLHFGCVKQGRILVTGGWN